MAKYDRDYSVLEIKSMIQISERRNAPFNPNNVGHAFRDHHNISDADVITRQKSAFIISMSTGIHEDTLDPAMIGKTGKLSIRTISDQPFMVARILNTNFGQAALKLLNVPMGARMTIHAKPALGPGGVPFTMRVASGGLVDSSQRVQHIVMVIDNGGREGGKDYLHFVTAFPVNKADYRFKFGPGILRTRPGVEFMTDNGRKSLYLWSKDDQNADGTLDLIHMA